MRCKPGTYSFNTTDIACSVCPPEAECLGGSEIELNSGYWRPEESMDIYRCPRPENCFNVEDSDINCASGYTGRLCTI